MKDYIELRVSIPACSACRKRIETELNRIWAETEIGYPQKYGTPVLLHFKDLDEKELRERLERTKQVLTDMGYFIY